MTSTPDEVAALVKSLRQRDPLAGGKWAAITPIELEQLLNALSPPAGMVPEMPNPPSHWPYAEQNAWKAGWYAGTQAQRLSARERKE